MSSDELQERITDQFSYHGDHADIWRIFDRILDTEAFLNLGYSAWYQPHVLGSSQRRLAVKIASEVASRFPNRANRRLLEVGCGRGGPTIELAKTVAVSVTGIDLVPYNVATARKNAENQRVPAEFLVGDAAQLPIKTASVAACTAIDSIVYISEKDAIFDELARVLEDGGVLAVSDLLMRDGPNQAGKDAVADFAAAWDMPPLATVDQYLTELERAGFTIDNVQDITANSVGRFHKWTWLFLLLDTHARGVVEQLLAHWGVDRQEVTEQVRCAHRALPHLKHCLIYATHS